MTASQASHPNASPKRRLALILEAARPKQWIKNVFVFAGLVFSGNLLVGTAEWRAWTMFAAFCLASSAIYLINDAVDAPHDRLNPRTASRPIARGDLAASSAMLASSVCGAGALLLSFFLSWQAGLVIVSYFVLQFAYSLALKRVAILDVMAIALGFVLRALGGLVAIPVEGSTWLLVCTGFLALFLGLGKRRGEIVNATSHGGATRRAVDGYTLALIDQLIGITTAAILVSYSIYAIIGSHAQHMGLTIPLVTYGVFRVLQVMHIDSGMAEDPSSLALRDRPLRICIAGWVMAALVIATSQ